MNKKRYIKLLFEIFGFLSIALLFLVIVIASYKEFFRDRHQPIVFFLVTILLVTLFIYLFYRYKEKDDKDTYGEEKKPLIVCIHGFGKRRADEYKNLIDIFKNEYEIITPELFNQENKDDTNYKDWLARAEKPILENKDRDIYLIGYSMGGVIASYLASRNPNVKKLVLLEPAFEWLRPTTVKTTASKAIGLKKSEYPEYTSLPGKFTTTFMNVVSNCKDSIQDVTCPTLFIHCLEDELIPWPVSQNAYKKAKCRKLLIALGGGCHKVMDDEKLNLHVFWLIDKFLKDKLPLEN